jgi:hypothetical protein
VVRELRHRSFARIFRRLLLSVELTDAQRTAILRRQHAVGFRARRRHRSQSQSDAGDADGDAWAAAPALHNDTGDADADGRRHELGSPIGRTPSPSRQHRYGADLSVPYTGMSSRHGRSSSVPRSARRSDDAEDAPAPVGDLSAESQAAFRARFPQHEPDAPSDKFLALASDADYVSYESGDSEADEKPPPEGSLPVEHVWTMVLHPDLEAVVVGALRGVTGDVPFPRFCKLLDDFAERTRPNPSVFLLTKARLCVCLSAVPVSTFACLSLLQSSSLLTLCCRCG